MSKEKTQDQASAAQAGDATELTDESLEAVAGGLSLIGNDDGGCILLPLPESPFPTEPVFNPDGTTLQTAV
ncbi:MAG TPA: hypothetical protein VF746_03460 [Longimicrobium sp.]